jgi:hypothetical protein
VANTKKGSARVGGAGRRDLALLHGLQQRGLGLGRGAVDLVGEQEVGEHRARDEAKLPPSTGGGVLLEHLGAGDVGGHQVGCELDTREPQVQYLARAC